MKNFNQIITETVRLWMENEESYYWETCDHIGNYGSEDLNEFVVDELLNLDYEENPLLYDIVETALTYVDWEEIKESFNEVEEG